MKREWKQKRFKYFFEKKKISFWYFTQENRSALFSQLPAAWAHASANRHWVCSTGYTAKPFVWAAAAENFYASFSVTIEVVCAELHHSQPLLPFPNLLWLVLRRQGSLEVLWSHREERSSFAEVCAVSTCSSLVLQAEFLRYKWSGSCLPGHLCFYMGRVWQPVFKENHWLCQDQGSLAQPDPGNLPCSHVRRC